MIEITIRKSSDTRNQPQTLVVFAEEKGNSWHIPGASAELKKQCQSLAKELDFTDLKSGIFHAGSDGFPSILVVARDKSQDLEKVRRLVGTSISQLRSQKIVSASLHFDSLSRGLKDSAGVAQAFAEATLGATYVFDTFKSKKKDKKKAKDLQHLSLYLSGRTSPASLNKGIKTGITLGECVNLARELGDAPGNKMNPEILAKRTISEAKGSKLKVTVWDKARIKKEKFGGLLGVSLGGGPDPRFIIMEYKGAAKSKKPVAFVGKGLTFDSGGISIKPSASMEEMKYDMQGGASVVATMLAIARLGLKVNAIGLVPSTENMPGPMANKPGDILTARNGKTVEVYNTDAEGRLILMDALSYASELKPAAIFDAATLTGAMIVALGNSYTGVFTRNSKLMSKVQKAADKSGEWVWPMPISDHHVNDMKGLHADFCNISSFRGAGSSTAAAFLEQFVDKSIPWAHFDIAGTAWNVGNRINYCPRKGASGSIVRTFVELAKEF